MSKYRYLLVGGAIALAVILPFWFTRSKEALHVFNWSDYIDPDLVAEFEKKTGTKVEYSNYSSDAELEAKLATGGGYDVVFPSDRSMPVLLKKGQLAEIDQKQVPNWKHLDRDYLGRRFDPDNRYSVPYFWGTLAVGVRGDKVTEDVEGFEALFDERYKGRITMLDDFETVIAVALLHLGLPMNSTDDEHLTRAKELLIKQRPLVQSYTSDGYKEKLISGEAWVALGWSGDVLQARDKEAQVKVVTPKKGTMLWVDSLAIPKDAPNKRLAHEFINFLLDPEVAARNANFVKYPTPNKAARERLNPEVLADPDVYPPADVLGRCQWLQDRGGKTRKLEEVWKEVRR